MTIEIRELVIQACVSDTPSVKTITQIKHDEQRMLDMIRKQVKEEMKDVHRRDRWKL